MLSNGGGDVSYLLQLIEELCRQNDKLIDDARKEREDLQQQVKSFIMFTRNALLCMISNYSTLVCQYGVLKTTCLCNSLNLNTSVSTSFVFILFISYVFYRVATINTIIFICIARFFTQCSCGKVC